MIRMAIQSFSSTRPATDEMSTRSSGSTVAGSAPKPWGYLWRKLAKANWQFTTDDARVKLKRLYPSF